VRIIELLSTALTDMRESPQHRLLLEVAVVRATAPETDPSPRGLLGRIERVERRLGIEGPTETSPEPVQQKSQRKVAEPSAARDSRPEAPQPARRDSAGPATPPAPTPAEVGLGHVRDAWAATLREVGRRSKRVGAYLTPSRPVSFDGERLEVEVQSEFHAQQMKANHELLADALFASLGIRPKVSFTPQGERLKDAKSDEKEEKVDYADATPVRDEDPVELVKRGLGAEVVEERG
jgi:DNA polymerase III gamma/tau subunit